MTTAIQPPLLTINKNLSGIDVLKDKTNLMTRVIPRGSGSPPSEVTLSTPQYWPSAQILEVDRITTNSVYFKLPNPYSSYAGFTKDGDPLPAGYYVGRNDVTAYNLAPNGFTDLTPSNHPWPGSTGSNMEGAISAPTNAMAVVFHMAGNWRPYAVSFQLQRIIANQITWATQPNFRVGLYSVIGTKDVIHPGAPDPFQLGGFAAPYQGPHVWCYGNLLSIDSKLPQWYTFPMQTNEYGEGWFAWVIEPYPTTNKQWSANDYLGFGASASREGGDDTIYSCLAVNGTTPNNWWVPYPGQTDPYAEQIAFQLWVTDHDVTSTFTQSNNTYPGRYVACPAADYVGGEPYIFHYMHAPYLINWDAEDQYGKYEGTWKNDTITTQSALMVAGAQYLTAVSEPTMTISLSAVDLYNIDPIKNWGEELYLGGTVRVIDDMMGLDETCMITKIAKSDLTLPAQIDTLTLNNIHANTQKLLAQVAAREKKNQAYMTGITVDTPYTASGAASTSSAATMQFNVRALTQLVHEVRLTVNPQDQTKPFTVVVDGQPIGGSSPTVFAGCSDLDIINYCATAHNGQVTPGPHTVAITVLS